MKWIKYKIVCNVADNILLEKRIGYSTANLAIAQAEADLLANSDVKPSRVFIKILIFVIILVFAFLYLKAKQNQKKKRKVKYYKGR